MSQANISKQEMDLLLRIIREKHLTLESAGMTGTAEHSSLRSLEDRLGCLSGKNYEVTAINYGTEFQSQVNS